MTQATRVTGITMVGSAYRNEQRMPGWNTVYLSDGKSIYVGEAHVGFNSCLDYADFLGYNTTQFRKRLDEWVKTGVMPNENEESED